MKILVIICCHEMEKEHSSNIQLLNNYIKRLQINHIINYYKDPHNPELIEKIIINLSLKECPKPVIMELIQFCEENFLSTGIIYLHTAVYN